MLVTYAQNKDNMRRKSRIATSALIFWSPFEIENRRSTGLETVFQGAQTLSNKTNTQQSLPIITTHETKFQLLSNADILQRKSHIPPCDDKNNAESVEIQCHFYSYVQHMHELAVRAR